MTERPAVRTGGTDQRYLIAVVVLLAAAIFLLTWLGIRENRRDSFALLTHQGASFTEALAEAAENALAADAVFDRLLEQRYSSLVVTLEDIGGDSLTEQRLADFVLTHSLLGAYVYGVDSQLTVGVARRQAELPPDFVEAEVLQLIANPELRFVLLFDEDEQTGEVVHYFLQLTNRLDRVIVLMFDARWFLEARRETGIGYLAQNMAREAAVEYIMYQSTEGIIFSSRAPGRILAIEADSFLTAALDSDTIMSRRYEFDGEEVLELVRPFATDEYPYGLFRVGVSLRGFNRIIRGFDVQMIVIDTTLFILLAVVLLYTNARRKRIEMSARYSEIKSLSDHILDQMKTGVAIIGLDGRVRLANNAFEKITGSREVEGKLWESLPVSSHLRPARLLEGDSDDREQEIELTGGNGPRTVLVTVSRVRLEDNRESAAVIAISDVTRLKEFERAAARKERLSELGNLAAGVAHEIRNPLNAISIAAQRLDAEFEPKENPEDYRSFTSKIRGETKRLNEIITRFLVLARDDKPDREAIALGPALREIVDLIRVEADSLNIRVEVYADDDATAVVSREELKQIILNLFSNTRQALDGREGTFTIDVSRRDGRLTMTVRDDGPGIPPDIREKVFAPYFTTKHGGTGLGLSAVYRIVTDTGGEVRLRDDPDGGAVFEFVFPVDA